MVLAPDELKLLVNSPLWDWHSTYRGGLWEIWVM